MTHLCDNWWYQDNLFSWPRQDRPRATQLWGGEQTHAQLNEENTLQLKRDISLVHTHPCFEQIYVTGFRFIMDYFLDFTNSGKRLWWMLASQFLLHPGGDTESAVWISLGRQEHVSIQALTREQRFCSTKVNLD